MNPRKLIFLPLPRIVGFAENYHDNNYNSAAVLQGGQISKIYRKAQLPNYGVFDERRYFLPGKKPLVINIDDFKVAVTICADIWNAEWLVNFLKSEKQIQIILNLSASPFHVGKIKKRQEIVSQCAKQFNSSIAYCNLVGGQDELIFDGRSMFSGNRRG